MLRATALLVAALALAGCAKQDRDQPRAEPAASEPAAPEPAPPQPAAPKAAVVPPDAAPEVPPPRVGMLTEKNRKEIDVVGSEADRIGDTLSKFTRLSPGGMGMRLGMTGSGVGPPADEIDRVMRAHAGAFRACYQKAIEHSPGLSGKVVVAFGITAAGKVAKARIDSTTVHDQPLEDCLVRQVRQLVFPRREPAQVRYPFLFSAP